MFSVAAIILYSCGSGRIVLGPKQKISENQEITKEEYVPESYSASVEEEITAVIDEASFERELNSTQEIRPSRLISKIPIHPALQLRTQNRAAIPPQTPDWHDDEAYDRFNRSILLMALGPITLGITYIIGLVFFFIGIGHLKKAKKVSDETRKKFRIALLIAIFLPLFIIIILALSSPNSVGNIGLSF